MSAERFFARVWAWVGQVPRGRLVTYGQVAESLGSPRGARAVGWALRALPEGLAGTVPWHRVVGRGGRIAARGGAGPFLQVKLLRAEGVVVRGGRADLGRYGLLEPQPARRGRPRRARARSTR